MDKSIITNSFEETRKTGEEIGIEMKHRVIALYGDLGSGKTTFVQGLARSLGIDKKIISPSFIILRSYKIKEAHKANLKMFYHVDLYRVKETKDIDELGLREIVDDEQNVVVIEWPEKAAGFLPKDRTEIFFEYVDVDKRRIVIK